MNFLISSIFVCNFVCEKHSITGSYRNSLSWINTSIASASAQRVKRNNFNSDDVSAADINQRLVKIASAVDDTFAQLELREEEVTPTTVRDELKRILNE